MLHCLSTTANKPQYFTRKGPASKGAGPSAFSNTLEPVHTIDSPEAMFELGKRIGSICKAGDLILLNGPLGAGKTVFVQGVGAALGIEDVTSPTFVISRIHKGPLPLIHVDVYRLLEAGKASMYLDDLDLDSPREESVTVIEWGGEESARLSDERLEIVIDRTNDARQVSISAIGNRWAGVAL